MNIKELENLLGQTIPIDITDPETGEVVILADTTITLDNIIRLVELAKIGHYLMVG